MSCNAHIRIAKFRLGLLAVGQVVCAVGCSLFLSQAGLAQVPSNDRLPVLTAPSRSRSPLESAEVQQYSQQYLLGTGDKVDVTVFNAPSPPPSSPDSSLWIAKNANRTTADDSNQEQRQDRRRQLG